MNIKTYTKLISCVAAFNLIMGCMLVNDGFADQKNGDNDILFDFSAPPKTEIPLTDTLSFGARIEAEYEHEDNFNLDRDDHEDESFIEPSLSMAFAFEPNEGVLTFLNIEPSYQFFDDEDNKKKDRDKLELIQAFVRVEDIIENLDVTVGRQRFIDDREWIYDEEMDGLRLVYYFPNVALDFSVSKKNRQDLLNDDDDGEKMINYMLHGRMAINEDHQLGVYLFKRDDQTSVNDDPIFLGAQLTGELDKRFQYWLNLGMVGGRAAGRDLKGYGGDVGMVYEFDAPLKPSLVIAYAHGSGDDTPEDGEDKSFRQTGLHDNDAKINGVTRVKTYGELFDPELSNMNIYTVGVGIRPTKKSSIDLVYHHYRQNKLSTGLRDSEIDADPNGMDKDLGHEVDLVVGIKLFKKVKASLALGYFMPGDSFGGGADSAFFVESKIKYTF